MTRQYRHGFSLIEATIGLLLIGVGISQLWGLTSGNQQRALERNLQVQMAIVGKAAKTYTTDKKTTIFASLPNFTTVQTLSISTLVSAGYLPSNFINKTPFDQAYTVYLRREDGGAVGVDASGDKIISLVLTSGGQTLDDRRGARIAGGMGAAGGFVYSATTSEATGAFGSWKINLADWGLSPGAGQLAYLTTYIGSMGGGSGGAQSLDDLDDGVTNYTVGSMFVGENAGGATSIGATSNATIIGVDAGSSGGAQTNNTLVGTSAGTYTPGSTADGGNTVVGAFAMRGTMTAPTHTDNNSVMGYAALGNIAASTVTLRNNVAVGAYAMYGTVSGSDRVAIGYEAMKNPSQYAGTNGDIAIGSGALYTPQAATYPAVAIGYHALYDVGRGGATATEGQTAIGAYAAENMFGDLHGATAIGYKAMQGVAGQSTGTYNTAVGWRAMDTVTTGSYNTATGALSMSGITTGSRNTAFGYATMNYLSDADDNVALGAYALAAAATRSGVSRNVAIGYKAMQNPSASMTDNVAVGLQALADSTGSRNVAVGTSALYNSTGSDNVGIGYYALYNVKAGSENVAVGAEAMRASASNTCATGNVAVGDSALYSVRCTSGSEGSYNTALGYAALGSLDTGNSNIAVGYRAGNPDGTGVGAAITTGSRNIIIGNNLGPPTSSTNDFMNIGGAIRADLSTRTVAIGGTGTELPSASYALTVYGDVESPTYTVTSDIRKKENISDLVPSYFENLLKLQPVRFRWKETGKKSIGFIAQDVQQLFPELVFGESGRLGVNYCGLVTPAIAMIKAQQSKIAALDRALSEQESKLRQLEAKAMLIEPTSQKNADPEQQARLREAAKLLKEIARLEER